MFTSYFRSGDEVAVLPHDRAMPSDVLEIVTINVSNSTLVQVVDGRRFTALGGAGLNTSACIVPARAEHRNALQRRHEECQK